MENEELFRGTFILDGTPMTEQQQKEKVFELMKIAGIELSDEEKDKLIIGYEGATDEDGISETQQTSFVVYKPMEIKNEKIKELETLENQLDELKSLREKLAKETNITQKEEPKKEEITEAENIIAKLEELNKEKAKEYEKSYKDFKKIIEDEQEELDSAHLLSAEEIDDITAKYADKKEEINKQSIEITKEIDKNKKYIKALEKKQKKEEEEKQKREALGLSEEEYNAITSTLRKTNIMNAILEEKGLYEIISKKASERTKEEKDKLKETKEEILKEVSNYKKEHSDKSVIDSIEALYMLNVTFNKKKNAQVTKLTQKEIDKIKENVNALPIKIVKPQGLEQTYTPGKAPEDIPMDNIKERITIHKDSNTGLFYINKSSIKRFQLETIGEEIKINGVVCLQIPQKEVDYLTGNKDNDYSPYILDIKEFTNEVKDEQTDLGNLKQTIREEIDAALDDIAKKDDSDKKDIIEIQQKADTQTTERKYHVEEIINEITKDIKIKANDAKYYTASNIRIADNFKEDLHSGNTAYNIIHVIPSIGKAVMNFGRKLQGEFMLKESSKKAMEEVEKRLNELTSDKLEVLLNEYKGDQLITDMNNQINELILERLGKYAVARATTIDRNIKQDYANLFVILAEVRELENKGLKTLQDKANRAALLKQSADLVRNILDKRQEANNYISGGILGLEQEYEAVRKRLPYIGLNLGEQKNFDNKLQEDLAKYGKGLNEGLESNNNEAIVSNFVKLETCYFNKTKISNSLVGEISTGDKYHDLELGDILDDYIESQEQQEEQQSKK